MRIVGTGLPRTGTNSLKLAIEQLIGAPCYHMYEAMPRVEEHGPRWTAIAEGAEPDWSFLDGFEAIVDWPGSAVWELLVRDFPDAIVVHSVRDDASQWWRSVDATVGETIRPRLSGDDDHPGVAMIRALTKRAGWGTADDAEHMLRVYEEHDRRVRQSVDPDRMVVLNPSDGWEPLCAALGVPVPDQPYPESNSTEEYHRRRAERARDR